MPIAVPNGGPGGGLELEGTPGALVAFFSAFLGNPDQPHQNVLYLPVPYTWGGHF